MGKVLCSVAKDFGLVKEDIFQQLSTEYGTNSERIHAGLEDFKKGALPRIKAMMEDRYDASDYAVVLHYACLLDPASLDDDKVSWENSTTNMSNAQFVLREMGIYHDKDKDPVKWNEQWEAWLSKEYAPRDTYDPPAFDSTSITSQSTLSKIQDERKQLLYLQTGLCRLIEPLPIRETWLSLPPKIRRDHLLKAIVLASSGPGGAELNRCLCPEISISFLERDGGKGFLQLLLTSSPPGGASVVEPVFVGHPVFDAKYNDSDGYTPLGVSVQEWRTFVAMARYERNMFLSTFLEDVCFILMGLGLPNQPKIQKGQTSINKHLEEMKSSSMPDDVRKAYIKTMKEAHKQGDRICTNCRKTEDKLPDGKRFMQCTKCRDLQNRKVVYCDRACQANDWKHGNAPHKSICGKPFTLPGQPKSTPLKSTDQIPSDSIPQPHPEWSRPPALEEQISCLQADPSLSYVLMQPTSNHHHGIALADPPEVARAFINFRNRAFYSGDLQSVALMSKVLCSVANDFGLEKEDVLQQLSIEYGTNPRRIEAELEDLKTDFLPYVETRLGGRYDRSDLAAVMRLP
ncbi:hypothetical protein FRC01_004465 [Tulasnella sp. 417]|nr:hypothetical protein FRC01_004465 [Tulasnella sp. 417]